MNIITKNNNVFFDDVSSPQLFLSSFYTSMWYGEVSK